MTIPTSLNAPPIAVSPRPISSQFIEPKSLRPAARVSRLCTAINNAALPKIDLKPPTFPSTAITATNSARAPPIAVSPRPISSQDIFPNFERASAIFLQLSANANIATLFDNETPLDLLIILIAIENSSNAIPIPKSPLLISINVNWDIFVIASARIFIDSAIAIIDTDADTNPFGFKSTSVLDISRNEPTRRPIIIPIAVIDFATSPISTSEMVFNADDNIVIAVAIPTIDQILRPVVNAVRLS